MINNLLKEKNEFEQEEIINFSEKNFLLATRLISEDILKKYDLKKEKIGLLGIARSALPLLTAVAHYCDVREISVMQIQTTKTDGIRDFDKNTRLLGEMIQTDVDKFIILEDVVCYGHCSNSAINRLKNLGKKTEAVYSLVMNEKFKKCKYDEDIILNYVFMTNKKQWVRFFWDKEFIMQGEN